jgi:hypothetical protein
MERGAEALRRYRPAVADVTTRESGWPSISERFD